MLWNKSNLSRFQQRQLQQHVRRQWFQISKPIGACYQNNNRDLEIPKILLKIQITVNCDEYFMARFGQGEQFTVFLPCPARLLNSNHPVTYQLGSKPLINALIEQDLHSQCTLARTRSLVSSRNARS